MFKRNVGATDRAMRIILGLVLVMLIFAGPKTAWGWIGIIPLVTGLFGTCPLYSLLGFSTCPLER